ncbi:MAG: hypothetical protein IJL06_03035, partial [Kiritimatiellae bacterium]|nr:hypothetical protein [Kiritimatiellia bacterium]
LDRVSDPVRLGAPAPDGSIRFEAVAAGRPHVVAATWYPDWVADGAEGPYLLSSGQLVVYPTAREVVLRHAKLPSETVGRIVSAFALLALLFPASAAFAWRAGKRRPGRFPREAA